jgi:hypothetical protein
VRSRPSAVLGGPGSPVARRSASGHHRALRVITDRTSIVRPLRQAQQGRMSLAFSDHRPCQPAAWPRTADLDGTRNERWIAAGHGALRLRLVLVRAGSGRRRCAIGRRTRAAAGDLVPCRDRRERRTVRDGGPSGTARASGRRWQREACPCRPARGRSHNIAPTDHPHQGTRPTPGPHPTARLTRRSTRGWSIRERVAVGTAARSASWIP